MDHRRVGTGCLQPARDCRQSRGAHRAERDRAVVGPEAALCIVEAAGPGELRQIAMDYGVEAGTTTVANIAAIAKRPGAADCISRAGIMQLLR